MRKYILALSALMLFGGVASADRWGRGRDRDSSRHSGGTVVRDHRHREPVRTDRDRGYRDRGNYRQNNYRHDHNRVRHDRRPVYANNGRFVFHGGVSRSYTRPVFRQRYYDYRYRPQIVVQNYDPVPGYLWVQGSWNWNGYEWMWTDGYWAVDTNYQDSYYNGGVDVGVSGGIYYDGGY